MRVMAYAGSGTAGKGGWLRHIKLKKKLVIHKKKSDPSAQSFSSPCRLTTSTLIHPSIFLIHIPITNMTAHLPPSMSSLLLLSLAILPLVE